MRDNVKKVTSNKLGVSLRVPTDVYEDKLVLDVGILKLYSRFLESTQFTENYDKLQ